MDSYHAYESPSRLARRHKLNTIIEDRREEGAEGHDNATPRTSFQGANKTVFAPYIETRASSVSPVPSLTSSQSSYHLNRRSADLDSLYDLSDNESEISLSIMTDMHSVRSVSPPHSLLGTDKNIRCPSLVIPSPSFWPSVPTTTNVYTSPPRPPKIPLSPAALSMLGQDIPRLSNPPSLAGSMNTDSLHVSSFPSTPESQENGAGDDLWGQTLPRAPTSVSRSSSDSKRSQRPRISICTDTSAHSSHTRPSAALALRSSESPILGSEDELVGNGVELPFDAYETLQQLARLAMHDDIAEHIMSDPEMREAPAQQSSAVIVQTPLSSLSEYSISQMSIPSPSNFFASLNPNARLTWHVDPAPLSAEPPTSTTAEQYYRCPWNMKSDLPVEHIFEMEGSCINTDGPPTARQIPLASADSTQTVFRISAIQAPECESPKDEDYDQAIEEAAKKSLDRTSDWLAQQTSYLSALRETNPANDLREVASQPLQGSSGHARNDSLGSPSRKAVRFLETEAAKEDSEISQQAESADTIFYHAFQHIKRDSRRADVFRHRLTRSDSIQSVRLCMPHAHVDGLSGIHRIAQVQRPAPQRPISMMPGETNPAGEETSEQQIIANVDRERQAIEQVSARAWIIEASRYLAGGSLLSSPARHTTIKTPKLGDIENGHVRNPAQVLDLGGLPNGDWAWHCAREFPHAKIHTATTEQQLIDARIRGPHNHQRTAVKHLWQLPYPDNYFHAISARNLYTHLKTDIVPTATGAAYDEYDLTLRECLRCLKPGGYLEFTLLDAEVVNAGTRGSAASVEFSFNLQTRGYDPNPTKTWLRRVRNAGFDDIKRAWTFLPMGPPTIPRQSLPETPPPVVSTFDQEQTVKVEAVQGPIGSTSDAASVSGLVGSWAWEQWMLKLQIEMGLSGDEAESTLRSVGQILEEGKTTGAGWRTLRGWARKPLDMV